VAAGGLSTGAAGVFVVETVPTVFIRGDEAVGMDIDAVAERASESLRAELGGAVLAVGRYSKAADQQARTVYTAAAFDRTHGENTSGSVLEDALLETIARGAYETSHDERLTATARLYETLVDVVVPLADGEGVVVAVHREADATVPDVVETVRGTVE
jgi:hypothetical protein